MDWEPITPRRAGALVLTVGVLGAATFSLWGDGHDARYAAAAHHAATSSDVLTSSSDSAGTTVALVLDANAIRAV